MFRKSKFNTKTIRNYFHPIIVIYQGPLASTIMLDQWFTILASSSILTKTPSPTTWFVCLPRKIAISDSPHICLAMKLGVWGMENATNLEVPLLGYHQPLLLMPMAPLVRSTQCLNLRNFLTWLFCRYFAQRWRTSVNFNSRFSHQAWQSPSDFGSRQTSLCQMHPTQRTFFPTWIWSNSHCKTSEIFANLGNCQLDGGRISTSNEVQSFQHQVSSFSQTFQKSS